MIREIIFRAKQAHNGQWMEGYFSKDYAGVAYITTLDGVSTGFVDESTLGQYTGLTDKGGVKIFEGDILRKPADLWIGNDSVGDKKGTFDDRAFVEYHDGTFRINQIGNEAKLYYGVINYSRNTGVDVMEVIGNIHDSPESTALADAIVEALNKENK